MSGTIPKRVEAPSLDGGADGDLVDVVGLAKLLFVHVNTAKRIPASELPYARIGGRGDRRYRLGDVRAYLAARRVES